MWTILARFHGACRRLVNKVRPKSLLGQAITYALGQWSVLEVFRERGEIEPERSGDGRRQIDNNRVENAIRPTAIGKKNCLRPCRMRLRRGCHAAFAAGRWLFIGATAAGSKSAVRYSLLGSCLQRGLNPREYLHWLFSRLPTDTNQTVAQLTPAAFADLKAKASAKPLPSFRVA